ncbi:MAG: hypothetical protein R3C02_07930 [Planctomycetaceae bacterium]
MMLGLGTGDDESPSFPVDISPTKRQHFGGTAESTIAGQGKHQLPLGIGQDVDYLGGQLSGNEKLPRLVSGSSGCGNLAVFEGIAVQQATIDRVLQKLLDDATGTPDRVFCQRLLLGESVCWSCQQVTPKVLGIAKGDGLQRAVGTEEPQEMPPGSAEDSRGRGLHIPPACNVTVHEGHQV